MNSTAIGLVAVVVALGIASGCALWLRHRAGQLRARTQRVVVTATELGEQLGRRATLLQFSTAFCQPCRPTRRILTEVAETVPGTLHVELDAEANLDLVRKLGVLRTPTFFLLDDRGVIRQMATGVPHKAAVKDALERLVHAETDRRALAPVSTRNETSQSVSDE